MSGTSHPDAPTWCVPRWRTVRASTGHAGPLTALRLILLIGAVDLAWNTRIGLSFVGWRAPLLAILLLLAVSFIYRTIRPVPALAELPLYAALWIAFSIVGAINTYLAASMALPLRDAAFAAFDVSLGFDWLAWTHMLRLHPGLNLVLRLAYASLTPQLVVSLTLFALARVRGRNDELLAAAAIALLLTSGISALLPALGHRLDTAYVAHALALRRGHPPAFALHDMQGVVSFPSYHTVLAVLLVHAHRGLRWSWPLVIAVNGAMLLSIPYEGGHYLADMLAGALVALLAIAIVRRAGRCESVAI